MSQIRIAKVPDPLYSSEYSRERHVVSSKADWYASSSSNPGVRGLEFVSFALIV